MHKRNKSHKSVKQRKRKKHVYILPHVCLQSKWLVVDYFWRCKAQRNEHFNSKQMWRSETCRRGHKLAQRLIWDFLSGTFELCEADI